MKLITKSGITNLIDLKCKNYFLIRIYFERFTKKFIIANPLIVSTIKNDTALSTGVELKRIREYKSIGKVGSEPIKNIVVFILEKLNIKATTKAPIIAGRRNGIVTYHIASNRVAFRLSAASSSVRSNFFKRAETSNIT